MIPPLRQLEQEILQVPPERLWDFFRHHDPVEACTLFGASVREVATEAPNEAGQRTLECRVFGVRVARWKEAPYEWHHQQGLAVLREFELGPLVRVWSGIEIGPAGSGSRICLSTELTVREGWGWSAALWQRVVRRRQRRLIGRLREFQATLGVPGEPMAQGPGGVRAWLWRKRLSVFVSRSETSEKLLVRLKDHLVTAPESEVTRMQPYRMAREWGVEARDLVRLFLHSAHQGMLELHWELHCPSCRARNASARSLRTLPPSRACGHCGLQYDTDLARTAELTFSVAPAIRRARPADSPTRVSILLQHVLTQTSVQPFSRKRISVGAAAEPVRLRVLGRSEISRLKPADGLPRRAVPVEMIFSATGWHPWAVAFRPGPLMLEIGNETGTPVTVTLERSTVPETVLTVTQAMCLPEFSALFANEAPERGVSLAMGEVCFLAAGLAQSISLCEELGNEEAFQVVARYLEYVGSIVVREGGTVLKHLGAEVLAVFATAQDALRAAREIQVGMLGFNRLRTKGEPLTVRIGVQHGDALAVRVDERLDFFGQPVNMVFRLQREASGGDIVVGTDFLELPEIRDLMTSYVFDQYPFSVQFADLAGSFPLARLVPASQIPAALAAAG